MVGGGSGQNATHPGLPGISFVPPVGRGVKRAATNLALVEGPKFKLVLKLQEMLGRPARFQRTPSSTRTSARSTDDLEHLLEPLDLAFGFARMLYSPQRTKRPRPSREQALGGGATA